MIATRSVQTGQGTAKVSWEPADEVAARNAVEDVLGPVETWPVSIVDDDDYSAIMDRYHELRAQ